MAWHNWKFMLPVEQHINSKLVQNLEPTNIVYPWLDKKQIWFNVSPPGWMSMSKADYIFEIVITSSFISVSDMYYAQTIKE